MAGVIKRAKRLKHLTRAVGTRSVQIFSCGFKPAIGYGMEVWGCSPSELKKLQIREGACLSPFTKGASLSTKLL
eukprot:10344633-Heterocapsa_arctica.AAC.1